MKQEKIDRAVSDLTTTAMKVYECVPCNEDWTTGQVCSELNRQGVNMSPKIIMGCLYSLKEDGLVKEVRKGEWIQVKAQGTRAHLTSVVATPEPEEEVNNTASEKTGEVGPRDPLLILMEFTEKMTQLRKEFDDAADEITRYIEMHQAEAQEDKELIDLLEKRFNRTK